MELNIITEIWDNIKDDVQEKNKVVVLKNILLVLEDNGLVDEDDLLELKEYDEYFESAVKIIYKAYEDLEEDTEDEWFED